ncbi:hypothetical protein [Roseimaritima ulvae]|uniref:PEP-CTERM protein-sorting domain-containing protein n=1 Tax=Roseimaritima ulvae TaxID=980254 RepID=A0A5B9QK85_9BACT|nr:hypothetical protein [Roseimaritima ulvae]QEG39478.1 hypothetical protein UC8_14730 [Roseimaritima ulvae]
MTRLFFALFLAGCSLANAHGALMYQLRFEQSNIQLEVGESQTVGVLFEEIYTAPDSPIFDLAADPFATNGLTTADFAVITSGPGGSAITAAAGNPHFDNFLTGPIVSLGAPTKVSQSTFLNSPLFATESGNVRNAQIGSITVTGGGNIGDVTTFSLADFNPAFGVDNFIIDDGLDSIPNVVADGNMQFDSLNATVVNAATVPEPSMITALTMLCCAGGFRRYRRKSVSKSEL